MRELVAVSRPFRTHHDYAEAFPLIKIASTEAVVARERVSPVFVRYPAERLLNERLMLGPLSVSTTNFGDSARCAPSPLSSPNFSSNRNVCSFKNIAGKPKHAKFIFE